MSAVHANEVVNLATNVLGARWGLDNEAAAAALADTAGDLGVDLERLAVLVLISARERDPESVKPV